MAAQENEALQVLRVPLDLVEHLENQAEMAIPDKMACRVVMDPRDQRVIEVKMALLVPQGFLDMLVPQGMLVHLENQVTEEVQVLLVQLAPPALLVFVVLLAPLEHEVIKVKLENVASTESRVIEDSLVIQGLLVQLVHWDPQVPMEVQDLPEQEDPLDLMALPERMVQAATLAPLVPLVPVEPEVKLERR
uniref:Uncharacterized protein n=1 Tax=Sphaerodactylus townsendi TaxID=933632 RepID=A0ACB8FZL7_9SAUR